MNLTFKSRAQNAIYQKRLELATLEASVEGGLLLLDWKAFYLSKHGSLHMWRSFNMYFCKKNSFININKLNFLRETKFYF